MEQDFQVNVTWFFAVFSGVLDWIVFILVWFERSLRSAQVSGQSCPWPLRLMMLEAVEGMWIRTGGYGRLRAEWVNSACCYKVSYLHVESHCLCISRGFVILFRESCKVEKKISNKFVLNLYTYCQLSQICTLLVLSLFLIKWKTIFDR